MDFYKDYVVEIFSIEGKTAIVTGTTGALGGATVAVYVMCRAKVVFTGRNKEKLEVLAGEIHDAGGEVLPYAANPSVEERIKGLAVFAVKQYGGLGILAVSHGYNKPQNILGQLVEDWQYIVDTDLKSVYMIVKYAGEQMARQGRDGEMIVISFARSKMGVAGYTGYCVSKEACDLMIRSLACDLSARYNISINTINPTVFCPEFTERVSDTESEVHRDLPEYLPIGRLGESSDFIGMVVFLTAPTSDFLTGGDYDTIGGYRAC